MRNFASVTDVGVAAAAFSSAPPLVDSAAFAAAKDVALNPSASLLMRVLSLRTLFFYVDRARLPSYDEFVSHARGTTVCTAGSSADSPIPDIAGDFTPLPLDANTQARDVGRNIQSQSSLPTELLSASYCLLEAWRAQTGLPSNAHWPFSTSQLTVDYICGNRFRIRNSHPVDVSLEWNVGSIPRKKVTIAHAGSGETFGERLLDAGSPGDLKLYYDGDVVITKENLGTTCP